MSSGNQSIIMTEYVSSKIDLDLPWSTRINSLPNLLGQEIINNAHELGIFKTNSYDDNRHFYYTDTVNQISVKKEYPYSSYGLFHSSTTLKKTSDFLNSLNNYIKPQKNALISGKFYPIAVRYTNNVNYWIIERPPFLAKIDFKQGRSNSVVDSKDYEIWIPWTVMVIDMDPKTSMYKSSLFFNDGPMSTLDEKAIPCFLMNMYDDGNMCLNQTSIYLQQHLADTQSFDIFTVYNFILNDYMSGGWNTDLGMNTFDRLRSVSSPFAQLAERALLGNPDLKTKISRTPSGRRKDNIYYHNVLTELCNLSLPEIMSLVASAKASVSNPDNRYRNNYRTYSQLIDRDLKEMNHSLGDFTSIFDSCSLTDSIQLHQKVFIHPNIIGTSISTSSFYDNYHRITREINKFNLNAYENIISNNLISSSLGYSNYGIEEYLVVHEDFSVSKFKLDDIDYIKNFLSFNTLTTA
jgi:hypothetical protein